MKTLSYYQAIGGDIEIYYLKENVWHLAMYIPENTLVTLNEMRRVAKTNKYHTHICKRLDNPESFLRIITCKPCETYKFFGHRELSKNNSYCNVQNEKISSLVR